MQDSKPHLVVLSTLFPHPGQPNAGVFIRERMFRVGKYLPLVVVAPVPWFPFQGLIRKWRPHYRPAAPKRETQDGFEVLHPRFFSMPGLFRRFDGFFIALSCLGTLRQRQQRGDCDLIDAHFAYPDGYAATLLGKWLGVPVTITLRGTEVPLSRIPPRRKRIVRALNAATRVFSVSESLRAHVASLGVDKNRIRVVGNGVDTEKFQVVPKAQARKQLGLPPDAPVLVSVGALVPRKGFHRVIACLPQLIKRFPNLRYLIIGGRSPEGDWTDQLRQEVMAQGLEEHVLFLGAMPSAALKTPLSAADVFVLATSNEGWANVFLEAMACGLPVVTTDVGGNAEVVCRSDLGTIVPFGDGQALENALGEALAKQWDRAAIIDYARSNSWDSRVEILVSQFLELTGRRPAVEAAGTKMAKAG